MIYTVSLGRVAKKALGDKAFATSITKITKTMGLPPETSGMDGVILCGKDVNPANQVAIQTAINTKNEGVCVIYITANDKEKDRLQNVYHHNAKKVDVNVINEVVNTYLGDHMLTAGKLDVTSKDDMASKITKEADNKRLENANAPLIKEEKEEVKIINMKQQEEQLPTAEEYQEEIAPPPAPEPPRPAFEVPDVPYITDIGVDCRCTDTMVETSAGLKTFEEAYKAGMVRVKQNIPITKPAPTPTEIKPKSADDYINGLKEFRDWNLLKNELSRNAMYNQLIKDNSEFQGLVQLIDILDKRIQSIFRDPSLTGSAKFEKIKETTRELTAYRATYNEITTNRALEVFEAVVVAAENIVNEKIDEANKALYTVSKNKAALMDEAVLEQIIQGRTKTQLDLLTSIKSLIEMYSAMDSSANALIEDLNENIPTSNKLINEQLRPLHEILSPRNSGELANRLLKGVQEGRLTCSQLESKLQSIIDLIFTYCEQDESIIRYQQNMIELLKANRVEEVVIVDSLIKHMMQVWVGPRDVGTTATALTWCGILSHRQNTLLIDLSGADKLTQYGEQPVLLTEFLTQRIEKPFCVVEGTIHSLEGLTQLVQELKQRLNYYPHVHIILSPEQTEYLNQLSSDAYVVHYITDSSKRAMDIMHGVIAQHTFENIARKLIVIDPAIDIISICEYLGADLQKTKVITIPNLPIIEACSLKAGKPYSHDMVVNVFEGAFR